jgi:hypothetical protein
VLFAFLFLMEIVGLWITFKRSPILASLPRTSWLIFFGMAPGSAFLNTVILIELLRVVVPKK